MKTKFIDNAMFVKEIDRSIHKLSAVASSPGEDRDGEVILASAWSKHLGRYKANPVILSAHTHRSFDGWPTIIGSAEKIAIEDDKLVFEMVFAKTALAQQWQSLYEDGHAKAFSVGFIPVEGDWKQGPDGASSMYVHTEVELLEISAVAVPANPDAHVRGVDRDELERLIDERVNRALEAMYAKQMSAILERKRP